jgi:alkylation response protein AidB-like acyl-CoA dehydrogenase
VSPELQYEANLTDEVGRVADPLAEPAERAEFRAMLRALVAEVAPPARTRELDDRREFDRALYRELAKVGVLGLDAPSEAGGAGDLRDQLVAVEELGRGPTSMAAFLILQYAAIKFLGRNGKTDEQRAVLEQLVAGSTLVSFGMSERDGATDLGRALRTRAELQGDTWHIHGQKMWTSAASDAQWIVVFARTEPAEGPSLDGISSLLVPIDAEGVAVGALDTFGIRGMSTCEVFFDDVQVPADALIGDRGQGMRQAFATINREGLLACAASLGVGHGALAAATEYVSEREVFGKPVGAFQVPQHWLVDGAVGLEAARSLMDRAAAVELAGGRSEVLTLMAKLLASETAQEITLKGMQMMGGAGYLNEMPMARYFRDVRLWSFSPLNNEMVRNRIGERLLRLPRSY